MYNMIRGARQTADIMVAKDSNLYPRTTAVKAFTVIQGLLQKSNPSLKRLVPGIAASPPTRTLSRSLYIHLYSKS